MSWIIYLVLMAFAIYICYNFAVLGLFGIPHSLSQTYYDFKSRKSCQRMLFPIVMIGVGISLLPAWLEISEGSNFMFMAFLVSAGILFTGAAPSFKESDIENKVHTGSAFFSATFALLWIVFVAKLWWFIIVWGIMISLVAIITNTLKSCLTYWLETVSIMSTFSAIIAYFVSK